MLKIPRALHGIAFAPLNTLLRMIALQRPPLEVQFPRYFSGLIVITPFILRVGVKAYSSNGLMGQCWRCQA